VESPASTELEYRAHTNRVGTEHNSMLSAHSEGAQQFLISLLGKEPGSLSDLSLRPQLHRHSNHLAYKVDFLRVTKNADRQ
jgi:hypothetical protein